MADDNVVRLKVDGELYEVDMGDLELGEVGAVEDLTGKSVQDIDWDSARGMQGLVWIAVHRKNQRFTMQEAGRIKFSAFDDPDEAAPPTSGAKPRAKSGAST